MITKYLKFDRGRRCARHAGGDCGARRRAGDIQRKGTLVVGTKADYRPFGFLDPSGKIVGFEPDLAADVAKRLGVKLELVPVVASNRIQFLQQGKIDLMIATMSDTPERRKIVDIVDPSYYGSGTNVLAPKSAKPQDLGRPRGKKVCLIQGAFYNKELQEKYGVDGVAFPGTAEAYAALKNGNCVAFAYDDTAIVGEMQKPEWSAYEMPLDSILFQPWGIAVKQGEKDLLEFMSKTTIDWHKTGFIERAREEVGHQAHQVRAGDAREVQVMTGTSGDGPGAPMRVPGCLGGCARRIEGRPMECLLGIGFAGCTTRPASTCTIFYDAFDRRRFASGFLMTVKLSAICIVLSVLIGIVGAWLQGSRLRFTRHVVYWYIQFFRNTPPLVQLYFFYFGVGSVPVDDRRARPSGAAWSAT